MSLNFQNKVIQFTLNKFSQFYAKMLEEKIKICQNPAYQIWKYCKSIALQTILSAHDSQPLRNMDKRMVMGVVKNEMIAQFQGGYISYPCLNQDKEFKYQVERIMI